MKYFDIWHFRAGFIPSEVDGVNRFRVGFSHAGAFGRPSPDSGRYLWQSPHINVSNAEPIRGWWHRRLCSCWSIFIAARMTPNARGRVPFNRSRINFEDPLFITTFTAELLLAFERRGPSPEKAGVRLHAEPRVGASPGDFNWSSIVQ
ncbi:MAG: hypothetical protein ACN6RK_00945 [Stenotrophomonas sp.]